MSTIGFSLISVLVPGHTQAPIERAVVITAKPIEAQERAKLAVLGTGEIQARYAALGFEKVERAGVAFLFGPEVWQGKALQERIDIWKEASRSVNAGGTIELKDSPHLARFAEVAFGGFGYGGASSGLVTIQSQTRLTLSRGGASKSLVLASPPTPGDEAIRKRPLKPLDPKAAKLAIEAAGQVPGEFRLPEALCAYSSARPFDGVQRMSDLATAGELLGRHYLEARTLAAEARKALEKRPAISASDLEGRDHTTFRNLPSDVQARLRSIFVGDYRGQGFADEGEAERWLSGAMLDGASSRVSIAAAVGTQNDLPVSIARTLP